MFRRMIFWLLVFAIPLSISANSLAENDNSETLCQSDLALVQVNFPTARANRCDVVSPSTLNLYIDPENKPINDSAWYAFRLVPKQVGNIQVILNYTHAKHRYPPKISYDGITWELLDQTDVEDVSETEIRLRIKLTDHPVYISAQESFPVSKHNSWISKIAASPYISRSIIGKSIEDRPIYKLELRSDDDVQKPYVLLVGRQHPPEVTGAMAMSRFVETLLEETELAIKFRHKYNLIIIPNMNPDGIIHGNWRHNMGGVDLNRDWGPFTQPETRSIKKELTRFDEGGDELVLFLDFHSTWRNLFYTQTDSEQTRPANFARDWLKEVDERLVDEVYKFTREQSPNSGKPTSKNYIYSTYGIPAITYEVGDNTDRAALALAAEIFAQEMMENLLKQKGN